jgi:putative tryptophan/tyrosine transport system substrate-binding protein
MPFGRMSRRQFAALSAGAALSWPLAARGQSPVVGFLNGTSPDPFLHRVSAFRAGLAAAGFVEHQTVTVQYQWANAEFDRLPSMAADLARRQVSVIAATGGTDAALAARHATSTIPVVFGIGGDPIAVGLVDDLRRPGGNTTGMTLNSFSLAPKQLELLRELMPNATTFGVLVNPANPRSQTGVGMEAAARAARMQMRTLNVSNQLGFEAAFRSLARERCDALIIGPDAYLAGQREEIITLAARYGVPTIYQFREFVRAGGLISLGSSLTDGYRQVGNYVGRVLKGEKIADLPVVMSDRFELTINLRTAKALGLAVPATLLARAAEVIE